MRGLSHRRRPPSRTTSGRRRRGAMCGRAGVERRRHKRRGCSTSSSSGTASRPGRRRAPVARVISVRYHRAALLGLLGLGGELDLGFSLLLRRQGLVGELHFLRLRPRRRRGASRPLLRARTGAGGRRRRPSKRPAALGRAPSRCLAVQHSTPRVLRSSLRVALLVLSVTVELRLRTAPQLRATTAQSRSNHTWPAAARTRLQLQGVASVLRR